MYRIHACSPKPIYYPFRVILYIGYWDNEAMIYLTLTAAVTVTGSQQDDGWMKNIQYQCLTSCIHWIISRELVAVRHPSSGKQIEQEPRRLIQVKIHKRFDGLNMLVWAKNQYFVLLPGHILYGVAIWVKMLYRGQNLRNKMPRQC